MPAITTLERMVWEARAMAERSYLIRLVNLCQIRKKKSLKR